MSIEGARERERQRFEHLVLGKPRPRARAGKGRGKRVTAIALDPGVDPFVTLREDWSHKAGTPETQAHAARTREGALVRLYRSEAIDGQQLDAAAAIAATAQRLGAEVAVRVASLEARVDATRRGDGAFYESLGRVRDEIAYRRWCAAAPGPIGALLAVIVDDIGLAAAARRHRLSHRRLRQLLVLSLDLWIEIVGGVVREVDRPALDMAHAAVMG